MCGRWLAFWSERERGTSLALFRIGCGLTVLATVGSVVLHGLAPAIWLDVSDGGYSALGRAPWLFRLLGGVNPTTMWAMVAVTLLSATALVIGLGGRWTALIVLQ